MTLKLTFLGATRNVTGSRFLLDVDDTRLLIDCGLYQEREFKARNWENFPVPPSSINALLLTHAHLDHSGYLPKLVKDGFHGRIYCTPATADITKIILLDSAKIQVEDAEFKMKRHNREGRKGPYPEIPLYTAQDAEACFPSFAAVEYGKTVQIADGFKVSFHDAGHILGASMIKVIIGSGKDRRIILFSGDVGRWNKPILRDPTIFSEADYVLVESTYGDRVHESEETIKESLANAINSTWKEGGNIVIPSFALERAQEVLYHLNNLLLAGEIPRLITFVDSPMAVNVTEVFQKYENLFDEETISLIKRGESPFHFQGLSLISATEKSKAINQISGTVIIIAGSGMCTGGRIKHHLVNNISRENSTILFVGYQANGTLGRIIADGAKEVRILGEKRRVLAKIARINGFSGHADRNELNRWLSSLKKPPRNVFVVHGETDSAQSFADFLNTKKGWKATVPNYADEYTLD
jgi:metallo-beta-lactamase family protein